MSKNNFFSNTIRILVMSKFTRFSSYLLRPTSIIIILAAFSLPCHSDDTELKINEVSLSAQSVKFTGTAESSSNQSERVGHDKIDQKYSVSWMRIQGTGFNSLPQENHILIDKWMIQVIKATPNEIIAIVPFDVYPGKHILTISTNNKSDKQEINLEKRTDKMNFPLEGRNIGSITHIESKITTSLTGNLNSSALTHAFIRFISRKDWYDFPSKKYDKDSNNEDSNIELGAFKIYEPPMDISANLKLKEKYLDQRNYLLSFPDVATTYPGSTVLVAGLFHGKNAKSSQSTYIEAQVILRDAAGIIKTEEPITKKTQLNENYIGNYEILTYFIFPLPNKNLFNPLEIELQLNSPDIKQPLKISKSLKIEGIAPTPTIFHSFLARKNIQFIDEDFSFYFNVPAEESIVPGEHSMLVNLYSIHGFSGLTDNLQCNFDVQNKQKTVNNNFTSTINKVGDAFEAYCVFEFYAPEAWTPGDYLVRPSLKTETNKVVTNGKNFKITVQPYQPSLEMYSWIVSPIQLESLKAYGQPSEQRMILLANALPLVNKGDRIGLLNNLEAKGFPPSSEPDGKHKISYTFTFQDSKGTKLTTNSEKTLDKVNGFIQIYHTLPIPEKLASGPITVIVDISIDNIKYQSQNGFVLY